VALLVAGLIAFIVIVGILGYLVFLAIAHALSS
jgi:hypothetical protein